MRQIHFVAFLQAQNCTTLPASWRHPDARTDTYSPEYYQHIARVLEAGKFDIGFFDDRLAMPDMYGGDHAHTVQNGIRCVKMDPIACLMTMAAATTRLGLGATYSTTYYEPFHVARLFQSVDLMTKGRAGWNVITSVNDNEARNMGRDGAMEHDTRYDRADEFMEVVLGHWDSWDDDAIVADKVNNLYAHPDKVRRLDYKGRFMSSRGPFTVPRSPQGHPVIIQAGMSDRGREFAARWGELLFVVYHGLEVGKQSYAAMKEAAAALGRHPDSMKICSLFYPVCAPTKTEAEDKKAAYDKLPTEVDQLSLLSEALNYDFATKGMDEPFSDEELAGIAGMQSMRDRVVRAGIKNPTVHDFMRVTGRGLLTEAWVGGPKEVADQIEEWFTAPASDGFVVAPTHQPGCFEEFVTHVVPELQRRGIYRKDYTGATLRHHLGLARPDIGAWRTNLDKGTRVKEKTMPSDVQAGNTLGVRPYVSLSDTFKDGSDSPRAFLERCLEVIESHEDRVGAFVTLNIKGARTAADTSTKRWQSGSILSPIDGMPVGIKDIMETADMATEQGSPLFVGWQGKRDCAAVAALRQAGAVVLGKTVTTEFAASHPSTTRNPWDHSRTPGGSSSGSAAAVGSGMIPAALGSQVIGSIIRPSSFCGCVGFKPSVGGINRGGSFDAFSQSCTGVLGATLADTWTVARAISLRVGGDPGYPGLSGPIEPPAASVPRRIALLQTAGWPDATETAKQALANARKRLEAADIEVVDRTSHDTTAAIETAIAGARDLSMSINAWEGHWPLNTYAVDMDRNLLSTSAQERLVTAQNMTQEQYQGLLAERQRIRNAYETLHATCDACMTLAAPGAAPVGLDWTGNPIFTVPTSLLGVPSLSLPVFEDDGLPLGLQLIGFTDRDAALFAAASAIIALFQG